MSKPYFCAVIGKGFGDEGKGMAVDFLASHHNKVLVVRHNGGAQSGHTVELPGKRFVFRELSSGSFRHADTLWADTFFPDLYKLGEEVADFRDVTGFIPQIYAELNTAVTIIDDVLLNMAAENARGADRHGSCGMGIYEAQCRGEAGYGVTVGELVSWNGEQLVRRLKEIRKNYLPVRLAELELCEEELGEFGELLKNDGILETVAAEMLENLRIVHPVTDMEALVRDYECVIFENGQGLLLDSENEEYYPHVTASRTGLINPCKFLQRINQCLDEVIYVTRSYVTRHGAGPLPYECEREALGIREKDRTNVENAWQGRLRYARHGFPEEFVQYVEEDLNNLKDCYRPICSLMLTHLNETGNCVCCTDEDYTVNDFCARPDIRSIFNKFYLSMSRYSVDISVK